MKIKKRDIFFYIAIFILMIKMIANSTVLCEIPSNIQNAMLISVIMLLSIKIYLTKMEFKETLIKVSISIFLFINYRICNESSLLILYMVVIAAKEIELKKIIKFIAIPLTFFLISCIFMYFINYIFDIDSINIIIRKTQTTNIARYAFFYKHPNVFAEHFCWVLFMWLYLRFNKITWITYIMILLSAMFLYIFPNSKTNAIILIVFIFIYNIYKIDTNKIIIFLRKNMFNICFAFSLFVMLLYNENNIIFQIDKLLTGRIRLGASTNEIFQVSLLGQILPIGKNIEISHFEWIMEYALDNFYYRIIYSYGILVTVGYLIFFNKMQYFLNKNNMKKELIFTTMLAIFGISEIVGVNIILAFPILFINKKFENKEKLNEKSINNSTDL